MDNWLAGIYGTDKSAEDDLEKTAQMHLLAKLAEEQGVDISGLDDAQLEELAGQVLAEGDEGGQQQGDFVGYNQPAEQSAAVDPAAAEAYLAKEAQAKFEEADFLGRVMAHAYTQELEKIAGSHPRAGVGRLADKAKNLAGRAGNAAKEHFGRNKGRYAVGGAAAGGAAAGVAAGRMSKKASAFEKLAEMHAQEILEAAGQADPSVMQGAQAPQGQPQQGHPGLRPPQGGPGMQAPQGQPGAADSEAQLQGALDERALQLLEENGYDVEAILAALGHGGQGQPQA